MSLLQGILLGLIQGLTEFLPVSSSGHLVIFEKIFGVEAHNLVFEVMVHFGTLIAVVLFFRKRLAGIIISLLHWLTRQPASDADKANMKMAWFLIIGTVPAAVIGLLTKSWIEIAFASPRWAAGMLLVTAAILFSTKWAHDAGKNQNVSRTLLIGFSQALAIMPGISRSGSTISAGMFTGMNKSDAAEFSFLLSLPAIGGAAVLEIPDFIKGLSNTALITNYFAGAAVAAVVGYLSIAYLLSVIKKGKFFYFGLYCAFVGILGIFLL